MTRINLSLAAAAVLLTIAGCGMTDPPADASNSVRSYCYPLTNGLKYRYAHFSSDLSSGSSSYDTLTYQLQVGFTSADPNLLLSTVKVQGKNVLLYSFIFGTDTQGRGTAEFSNATQHFAALDGNLADSSSWTADVSTTARVLAHYDEYLPQPSSLKTYQDVIEVQYHRSVDPPDNYTLRFYARGVGLILEKYVVGSATVIGTLQLVDVTG